MAEFICSHCGQAGPSAESFAGLCLTCYLVTVRAGLETREQSAATPTSSADGAIREGEPPLQPLRDRTTSSSQPGDDPKPKPTAAGCLLTLLCVAVIFGSAVPIVTWRDPDTGLHLPRMVAIMSPLMIGALCYALGAGLMKVLGIPIWSKPTDQSAEDARVPR